MALRQKGGRRQRCIGRIKNLLGRAATERRKPARANRRREARGSGEPSTDFPFTRCRDLMRRTLRKPTVHGRGIDGSETTRDH